MFDQVTSQKLRTLVEELEKVERVPFLRLHLFAHSLALYMRVELHRRAGNDEQS